MNYCIIKFGDGLYWLNASADIILPVIGLGVFLEHINENAITVTTINGGVRADFVVDPPYKTTLKN